MAIRKLFFVLQFGFFIQAGVVAQTFTWVHSSQGKKWQSGKIKAGAKASEKDIVRPGKTVVTFNRWGTCFNELGWDAINKLPEADRDEIMRNLFSPSGDLRFTMGRIPMNANDYARDWYSCDEVAGDFSLKYFNIDRDKTTLIPYIHKALACNPGLTFWASPWSPPSWMKINADYPVRSSKYNKMDSRKDYILFEGPDGNRDDYKAPKGIFPPKLSATDYFIQDDRYLSTYARYFSRFISAYAEQGIKIGAVMYQNEAWSYTPYPGCAWTPEGIVKFNVEYLAPQMKKDHPDVDVYFGTINTNRYDVIDKVLSDSRMADAVKGIGLQWEGGQILQRLRDSYPGYKYVQTEGECGWGSFDWNAAEHTFERICHYLGNGCEDYTFWNAVLAGDGMSTWGWKQNALIRVDAASATFNYTHEYYAVKHYSHYVEKGDRVVAHVPSGEAKMPVLVLLTPENKYLVMAGNFNGDERKITVKVGEKYLNAVLQPHSLNTFVQR